MAVDEKCVELAEHFLDDVKGHTKGHVRELAEAIQLAVEDTVSMIEADLSAEGR